MIHGNWLQSWARVVPDKAALIEAESGKIVTYRQLENLTWQTCQFFQELGLKKGDRVAVLGQNRIEQIILYFAAARMGLFLSRPTGAWLRRKWTMFWSTAQPAVFSGRPMSRSCSPVCRKSPQW